MQPLVFAQPAARVIFFAALVLFMVVQLQVAGAGVLGRITRRKVRVVRHDRGSLLLVTVMTGVGIVGAFFFAAKVHAAAIAGGNNAIRWLCLAAGLVQSYAAHSADSGRLAHLAGSSHSMSRSVKTSAS